MRIMVSYRYFDSAEDFVNWQEHNLNYQVVQIVPVPTSFQGEESVRNTTMQVQSRVFVTFKYEIPDELNIKK